MRPAETQISLRIRAVWSESSLFVWRNVARSENSDKTARMRRLILIFAWRTCSKVRFLKFWLLFLSRWSISFTLCTYIICHAVFVETRIFEHACMSDMKSHACDCNMGEKVPSLMRKLRRFRSSCTRAKYHPGLCSPFIHSVVSSNSVRGQRRPWSDCADAQADLGLHSPNMPRDTFSHGEAHMIYVF